MQLCHIAAAKEEVEVHGRGVVQLPHLHQRQQLHQEKANAVQQVHTAQTIQSFTRDSPGVVRYLQHDRVLGA